MDKKVMILAIVLICSIAGMAGCVGTGERSTEVVTLYREMLPGQVLDILDSNGGIIVSRYNGTNVTIQANKVTYGGPDDLQNINISIVEENNHVQIKTVVTGFSTIPREVSYNILVPDNVTVGQVSTQNGAITITSVKGNVTASSTNGAIIMTDVDGFVFASTTNGHIELTGTIGVNAVQTSNGAIDAELYDLTDTASITTSNGAITLSMRASLNVTLDAQTSNSNIQIQNLTMNVLTSEQNHIVGVLGSGEKQLMIRTSNSRITIDTLQLSRP